MNETKTAENDGGDVTNDDVIVTLTADLQQLQDEETKQVLELIQDKVKMLKSNPGGGSFC